MDALILVGINILLSAALWGIGMLLRKPTHTVYGEIKNREIQISSYGEPKPILYGQCKTAMALIHAEKLKPVYITQEVGKGGGSTVTQTYYLATFAGMWGVAPDQAIFGELKLLKLYTDEKLVYNAVADDEKVIKQSKWVAKKFKFYPGSATQLPDPTLEAKLGVDNVPAYRYRCYGVLKNINVTSYGNRIPTMRAVVAPGTEAPPNAYPVPNFTTDGWEGEDYSSCSNAQCARFLTNNEIFIITVDYGYDLDTDRVYNILRKVNTYTRSIIAERIYWDEDVNPYYGGDCGLMAPFVEYGQFGDIDEQEFLYFASCGQYGAVVKLDSDTFTIQAATLETDADGYQMDSIRVSKNPIYPYLWILQSGGQAAFVALLNRDTLTSPFGSNWDGYGYKFDGYNGLSGSQGYVNAGLMDINNSDGSIYVVWWNYDDSVTLTGRIIERIYPDGRREPHDMTLAWGSIGRTPIRLMCFDGDSNQIIWADEDGYLNFFDADDLSYNGSTSVGGLTDGWDEASWQVGVIDGYLYTSNNAITYGPFTQTSTLHKIDINTMEVVDSWDISSEIEDTWFINRLVNPIYVSYKSSFYANFRADDIDMHEITVSRITPGSVALDDVVSDICYRSGLNASQINTAQLTDEVKGYCVSQDQSAREALDPLMEAFIFDMVEVDGVLTAVKRGGASVATIPEADLAAFKFGSERPQPLVIEGKDEIEELPRRTECFYPDIDRKHEVGVQDYSRQVTDSKLIKKIQTPVLFNADDAKQLAHISFKYDWQTKACSLSLGPKYAKLMPCDVVTVQRAEGDYRVLLLEVNREGLLANWKGLIEDMEYTSTVDGIPGPTIDEDVDYPGPSIYYLLDTPPLLDSHDYAGIYMASGAMFEAWHGCEVWVSKDNGTTFSFLKAIPQRATTGVAVSALNNHSSVVRDRHSTLTIRWDYEGDALASVTESEFLQGQGHYLAIIKNGGSIEIVCAKTVVTNGDGTQSLTDLIRGCKGTEYAMDDHLAGEKVVKLSMSTMVLATLDSTYLNQSYLYNGVTVGDGWEDGIRKIFTTNLNTLKPYSPWDARGTRDGSNNLTIEFSRRNRLYGNNELFTGNEIPMSEASEAYEVDILDAPGGSVLRTIDGLSSESASYSAAQQTADGLTPGDPVYCNIYQMSAVVGRGWPLAAVV